MREERERTGRLQRARRAALDQDITRQEEAIERWQLQAQAIASSPAVPVHSDLGAASSGPEPHEARVALAQPDDGIVRALGEWPPSLSARDEWIRQALQLVGQDPPALAVTPEPATMDGFEMDI
jgi:hypothetical protein